MITIATLENVARSPGAHHKRDVPRAWFLQRAAGQLWPVINSKNGAILAGEHYLY
jgi:hypothetical protein